MGSEQNLNATLNSPHCNGAWINFWTWGQAVVYFHSFACGDLQFSQKNYWRGFVFPTVCIWFLCQKLFVHKYEDLILDSFWLLFHWYMCLFFCWYQCWLFIFINVFSSLFNIRDIHLYVSPWILQTYSI